jgi:hypothetical protein
MGPEPIIKTDFIELSFGIRLVIWVKVLKLPLLL